MIDKKMEAAINEQINAELYSSYLYLSMAAYFEGENLSGFANWMKVQADEERFHGMKFNDYVFERGGQVVLKAIEAPKITWESSIKVFEETLAHEKVVTGLINNLMDIAVEIKDYASQSMLHWFIDEQVEEEASASEILEKLKMVKGSSHAVYQLDKEMSSRVFTPPTKE